MSSKDVERNISELINEFNQTWASQNYEQALSSALSGYLLSHKNGDKLHEKIFLSYLKSTVDDMHNKIMQNDSIEHDVENRCSFCCEEIGNSLYVLGPNVSICEKCIKLATEIIEEKKGTTKGD